MKINHESCVEQIDTQFPPPPSALIPLVDSRMIEYNIQMAIFYVVAGLYAATGNLPCQWDFENSGGAPLSPCVRDHLRDSPGRSVKSPNTSRFGVFEPDLVKRLFTDVLEMLPEHSGLTHIETFDLLEEFPHSEFDEKWVQHIESVIAETEQEITKAAAAPFAPHVKNIQMMPMSEASGMFRVRPNKNKS